MPISIECPACHHEYKVGDNLAGKKVKCRECGETISVSNGNEALAEPDLIGLDDEAPASSPGQSRAPAAAGPSVRRCPSCRTVNAPAAIRCTACGYNLRPEPEVAVEAFDVAPVKEKKKKSRFVRAPGNPTLESIDGLITLILWWGSIAALAVWVVHIARSPSGISLGNLLPVFVVLALGALVLAPLATLAIKITANLMKFPPRHDTYSRALVALLLPFSASLLTGWPGNAAPIFGQISNLAWIAFPALFIYMFRAEMIECVATVVAGAIAVAVGWGVGLFVISMITNATGPLYADMLPPGPWQSMATGQSPVPAPPSTPATHPAVQVAVAPTTAPTTEGGTTLFSATPPDEGTAETTIPNGAQRQTASVTHAPGAPGAPTPPTVPLTPTGKAPTPDAAAQPTFFSDVGSEDPNLQGVRDLITVNPPAPWMLLVKGGDNGGAVTAERWSVQPASRKGVLNFSELPKQPNSYCLSPKGDVLVSVVRFPRNQVQVSTFDNKPPRTIPLPDNSGAIPSIMGFVSPTQYIVRWDLHGMNKLQAFNVGSTMPARTASIELHSMPTEIFAVAPNGHTLATIGMGTTGEQIIIYNLDTGMVAKRISPTSASFRPLGIAYSPDSSQVALYATVSEVSTILAFNVSSGQPGFNGMLETPAASAQPRDSAHAPPLLWLQNNLGWLVNGNDLYETTTGKKIGSLNLPDVIDARPVGSDSLAIVQATADGSHKVTVARFDDAAIKGTTKPAVANPPPAATP